MAPQPAPGHAVGQRIHGGDRRARDAAAACSTRADFVTGAAPVAIVNEPFVSKFLGGRNPIGRRIRVDNQRPAD